MEGYEILIHPSFQDLLFNHPYLQRVGEFVTVSDLQEVPVLSHIPRRILSNWIGLIATQTKGYRVEVHPSIKHGKEMIFRRVPQRLFKSSITSEEIEDLRLNLQVSWNNLS